MATYDYRNGQVYYGGTNKVVNQTPSIIQTTPSGQRDVYRNQLDVAAYNKYVEEQSSKFTTEYQQAELQLGQKLKKEQTIFGEKSKPIATIEAGGDPQVAAMMKAKRERALVKGQEAQVARFAAEQKAKSEALQKSVEAEQGRFTKRVLVGQESSIVVPERNAGLAQTITTPTIYENATWSGKKGTYDSSTGTFTSSTGEKFSVAPGKVSVPVTPEQIKQYESTGGVYITPTGSIVSIVKPASELNKGLVISTKSTTQDFFGIGKANEAWYKALSANKPFIGQYVKIASAEETNIVEIEARAKPIIEEAKIGYGKEFLTQMAEQQKAQIAFENRTNDFTQTFFVAPIKEEAKYGANIMKAQDRIMAEYVARNKKYLEQGMQLGEPIPRQEIAQSLAYNEFPVLFSARKSLETSASEARVSQDRLLKFGAGIGIGTIGLGISLAEDILPFEPTIGGYQPKLPLAKMGGEALLFVNYPVQSASAKLGKALKLKSPITDPLINPGKELFNLAVAEPEFTAGYFAGQIFTFGVIGKIGKGFKQPKEIVVSRKPVSVIEVGEKKSLITRVEYYKQSGILGKEIRIVSSYDVVPVVKKNMPSILRLKDIERQTKLLSENAMKSRLVVGDIEQVAKEIGGIKVKMDVGGFKVVGIQRAQIVPIVERFKTSVGLLKQKLPSISMVKAEEANILKASGVKAFDVEGRSVVVSRQLEIPEIKSSKIKVTSRPKLEAEIIRLKQVEGQSKALDIYYPKLKFEASKLGKGIQVSDEWFSGFTSFGQTAKEAKRTITGFFEKQKTYGLVLEGKEVELGKISKLKTPAGEEIVFKIKKIEESPLTASGKFRQTFTIKPKRLEQGFGMLEKPQLQLPSPKLTESEIALENYLSQIKLPSVQPIVKKLFKPPTTPSTGGMLIGGGTIVTASSSGARGSKTLLLLKQETITKPNVGIQKTIQKPTVTIEGVGLNGRFKEFETTKTIYGQNFRKTMGGQLFNQQNMQTTFSKQFNEFGSAMRKSEAEAQDRLTKFMDAQAKAIKQSQKQLEAQMQKTQQKQSQAQTQTQTRAITQAKTISDAQLVASAQDVAQANAQKQAQRQLHKTLTKTLTKTITGTPIITPTPNIPRTFKFPSSGQFKEPEYGGRLSMGYFGEVKRRGKWVKVNKTPLTASAAWNVAAREADKTLAQSIKLMRASKPATGTEEMLQLGKFRSSKYKPGVLVEKKKFALEPLEVREIKQAKRTKERFKLSL
jgi:hypothetical protein